MDAIDIYCERTTPEFWAEPLNAISNLAFLLAAFVLWRAGLRSKADTMLVGLIFLIGIGSGLFHTFANRLTLLADVLPILAFQITFLMAYAAYGMKLRPSMLSGVFMLFIGSLVAFGQLPQHWLNGSLSYLPALLFLSGFALWRHANGLSGRNWLAVAALVFTASLAFRSFDHAVCNTLPIGLHYMWHILNAVVLYSCIRAFRQDAH